MREIKFRAIGASGEMLYGLPSHDLPNTTAYYDEFSHRMCWHTETGGLANQPYKNGTLMQYTGLKDENGVEIFEGDVVVVEGWVCRGDGYYDDSIQLVSMIDGAWSLGFGDDFFEEHLYDTDYVIKVVGNIHQNPELLENPND